MADQIRARGARAAQMTRRERVRASFRGEPTDRPPISFWQHFPGRDHSAERLAEATLAYQRQFDLDLVKLMPTGMYSVLDYGVQVRRSDDDIGTTRRVSGPVREPADWRRLPGVSPARGVLAQQVEVVRRVRAALGPDTPILQTIFSPLTMAAKIVGDLGTDVLEHEDLLREALERMANDVVAFGRACLEAGGDGFFFATQLATRTVQPAELYVRLGVPYDLKVLEALRPGSSCTILHLHGLEPAFELADLYPVDAVNWHDRETAPALPEALTRTDRGLTGGIARMGAVATAGPKEAAAEVADAAAQTDGRRLLVAPGCVIPLSAPAENLLAARRAVDAWRPGPDPRIAVTEPETRQRAPGRVAGIYVTSRAGDRLVALDRVHARAGRGLGGDRYAAGEGTWSKRPGGGRQLTIIAREDLDALARDTGIVLRPDETRRNILVTGINLAGLIDKRFRVGNAVCRGVRLCYPCAYLEGMTQPGVVKGLLYRGGLRADILEDGAISVGDTVERLPEPA